VVGNMLAGIAYRVHTASCATHMMLILWIVAQPVVVWMGLCHVLDQLGRVRMNAAERMRACLFQVLHQSVMQARLESIVKVSYLTQITTLIACADMNTFIIALASVLENSCANCTT
jgi:hypothetical protein